jgi:predicted nucleic acid-binding protein
MKYLLDTNVFREIGKQLPHANVRAWLDTVDDSALALSALTVREVTKGIIRLRASKPTAAAEIEARVATIFAAFSGRILPVDSVVAAIWGEMLAENEKHIDDACFAATVRAHDLILVTRNTRHLAGRRVKLLNPYKLPAEGVGERAGN